MKKLSIFVLCLAILFISGCKDNNIEKFYLDDNYYGTSGYVSLTSDEFNNLDSSNYLLYTYNNYCMFSTPCETIFKDFMEEENISMLSMKYDEFKKTNFHDTVRFAPSVIIVKNNKIIAYLDAEVDEDLDKYQDVEAFKKWLSNYINLKK